MEKCKHLRQRMAGGTPRVGSMKILITKTDKECKVQSDAKDPLKLMAVLSLTLVDAGASLGYSKEQTENLFREAIRRRYK